MISKRLVVLAIALSFAEVNAQDLRGLVTSNEGPLPGATIKIENTLRGTAADKDGMFLLKGVSYPLDLHISSIGFKNKEVRVEEAPSSDYEIVLEKDIYLAQELIVEGTRVEEQSPFSMEKIDREEIRELNTGRDVPYILNQTVSMVSSSDAGAGIGYTAMRIRGIDQTNINVTINGIALNDAESFGVYWVNIPDFSSSVNDIQIQRGIGSSTNGAGAFGATVNLQTDVLNAEPYGEVMFSGGSFNTSRATVRFGSGVINKYWSVDGRISRIQSDGYVDRASSDLTSYYLATGFNNGSSSIKFIAFGGREKTYQAWYGLDKATLETDRTFNYAGAIYRADGSIDYYDNQIDNYAQDHFQLHWNQKVSDRWNFHLAGHYTWGRGYFESYHQDDLLQYYGLPDYTAGVDTFSSADIIDREWLDNDYYGAIFNLSYKVRDFSFDFGGGLNQYIGDHFGEILWSSLPVAQHRERYYFNRGVKDDYNVYARALKKFGRIEAYADVQVRSLNYSVEGDQKFYGYLDFADRNLFVNPKIGASYSLNEHSDVYYSIAYASREPNRNDYLNAPGNEARPERMQDHEMGYRWNKGGNYFAANLYYMYYSEQLALTGELNSVGEPLRSNVGNSYRAGIELSAGIGVARNLNWMPNVSFSDNRNLKYVYPDDQGSLVEENTPLSYSPNIIVNNRLQFRMIKSLYLNVYSNYVGEQFLDNTGSKEAKLSAYLIHDIRIEYRLKPKNLKQVSVYLNVNNFLDEEYVSNGYMYFGDAYLFPQAKRNFLAGLNVSF